jgi:hypothetical protein
MRAKREREREREIERGGREEEWLGFAGLEAPRVFIRGNK